MDNPVTNLAIREVTQEDAPQVAALLTQLGYPSSTDDVTSRLAYWKPVPFSLILIAERTGRALGCLSMHAIPYLEQTGRWVRIESLVVDESARGTGTGRALLAAAETAARRWGCLAIEITSARTREAAQAFYRHMGYSDVCDRSARFHKVLDADTWSHPEPSPSGWPLDLWSSGAGEQQGDVVAGVGAEAGEQAVAQLVQ